MNDRLSRVLASIALSVAMTALGVSLYALVSIRELDQSTRDLSGTLERLLAPRPQEGSQYGKPPPTFDTPD